MAGDLSRVVLYSSFNSCFLQLQKKSNSLFLEELVFPKKSRLVLQYLNYKRLICFWYS